MNQLSPHAPDTQHLDILAEEAHRLAAYIQAESEVTSTLRACAYLTAKFNLNPDLAAALRDRAVPNA